LLIRLVGLPVIKGVYLQHHLILLQRQELLAQGALQVALVEIMLM
jgi:hypothetical protein